MGWNDVAFSGSSRPAGDVRRTRSKSGAGQQHRHAGAGRGGASASLDGVVVADPRGRWAGREQGRRGAARPRRGCGHGELERRPARAVGGDQGVRGRAAATACRGRPCVEAGADARRAAARGRPAWRRSRTRWIAPRKSGVSSWSTSMARPGRAEPPGSLVAAAAGRRRTGGGRRRSGPATPASAVVEGGERPRVADRPDPVPLLAAVDELAVGGSVERTPLG